MQRLRAAGPGQKWQNDPTGITATISISFVTTTRCRSGASGRSVRGTPALGAAHSRWLMAADASSREIGQAFAETLGDRLFIRAHRERHVLDGDAERLEQGDVVARCPPAREAGDDVAERRDAV